MNATFHFESFAAACDYYGHYLGRPVLCGHEDDALRLAQERRRVLHGMVSDRIADGRVVIGRPSDTARLHPTTRIYSETYS